LVLIPIIWLERGLERRIREVSEEVDQLRIYGQTIDAQRKEQLKDTIGRFHAYSTNTNTWQPSPPPGINIQPDQGYYADLDKTTDTIMAGPGSLDDGDVVAHVYAHHFLQSSTRYGKQHKSFAFYGLEAGLADYLLATFNGRAEIGRKIGPKRGLPGPLRDLQCTAKFSDREATRDPHEVGEVWGSAFWSLGCSMGHNEAVRVLLRAWEHFDPPSDASSDPSALGYVEELLAKIKTSAPEYVDTVKQIFLDRSLSRPPQP
jgi:hypothetical protein